MIEKTFFIFLLLCNLYSSQLLFRFAILSEGANAYLDNFVASPRLS